MSRDRLVLVTQNKHKLTELTPLFKKYSVEFETTSHEKHEIRSDNVEEIALVAAQYAYKTIERPVLVDDTGFFVSALNDFPGSYPAYVLNTIGCPGILRLMEGVEDRIARFTTAVGYCDGELTKTFQGTMHGRISQSIQGKGGFGYDPIFIPDGFQKTYAELSLGEKISISHRTRAFEKFLKWYISRSE
ncbi:MAG: XTP/dITP diphosphatase [Candidatus Thorarchaeota archaeon]